MATGLGTTFLGNTLAQWIFFVAVLIIAFFGTKLLYWVISKFVKIFVSKTKTRLDDLLIESLEKPIIVLVIIAGIDYAKRVLTLAANHAQIFDQIVNVGYMIAVTWFIVRFVDALLANYLLPYAKNTSSKIDDTVYPLIKGVLNFILYALAILFIIDYLGFEVNSLLAGLGIGGLAFALAAQDVLSNFFGGAAVITDKPFKVGDRIIIEGNDGFVRKIGIRSTEIETFDGTKIVLPNKIVASSVLENISAERARRVKVLLGVEYGTSVKKLEAAKKVLAKIVLENESTDDKSLVHFHGFGASSLDIQLIYWIKDLDRILDAKDEINFAIKKEFEKLKIEFAYPSQTIYLKK